MTSKTTEELREYFKENGFKYSNLNSFYISVLKCMIEKHLKEFNKINQLQMSLSPLKSKEYEFDFENGGIKYFYFKVDGDYFKEREAISFNKDGFIGFAGWSDSTNIQPFKNAFYEWIHELELQGL